MILITYLINYIFYYNNDILLFFFFFFFFFFLDFVDTFDEFSIKKKKITYLSYMC